jgi:hypothetical protein
MLFVFLNTVCPGLNTLVIRFLLPGNINHKQRARSAIVMCVSRIQDEEASITRETLYHLLSFFLRHTVSTAQTQLVDGNGKISLVKPPE